MAKVERLRFKQHTQPRLIDPKADRPDTIRLCLKVLASVPCIHPRMRLPVCVLLLCCMLPIALQAQNVRHLTLQQAIDSAMTRDLRFTSLGLQMEAGTAARKQIPLRRFPQLRYNAGATYAPVSPYFGYDPAVSNGGQLNAQILATESLYDGGKRDIEIKQYELDYQHLDQERGLEKADLKLQITQGFVDVLHARESAQLQDSSLRELSNYQNLSRRLFAGGVVGETDVLSVESQVRTAELVRDRANADGVAARFALAALLGTPGDTSFTVDGTLADISQGPQPGQSGIDSSTNPELRIKQIEVQKAELDVELARTAKRPVLDLQGDAGLLSSIQNIQQRPGDRSSVLGASVGIVLEGPLLDWGANDLLIDQKSIEATEKRIDALQLARTLNSEYVRARFALTSALARLQPLKDELELASRNYSLMLAKYAGGAAKAIELFDAHRQVIESRAGILDTESDIATLRATLERLTSQ